jgi:hypothetical protein
MKLPRAHGSTAIVVLLLSQSLPSQGADDCTEWKRSYATYEHEVQEAIQDEPEDLLQELRRHARAIANGHADQAERIETKIRGGLTGLQSIVPHPDLARFHYDLVECYRNGVAMLDAAERGDRPAHRAAELRSWQAFRSLIVTLRDLLSSRGCDAGDVDAIDQKLLPQIDAEIEALQTGPRR